MDSMSGHVTISQATDIAEMVAIQPPWRLNYQQLSAGQYAGRIVYASLPDLHLSPGQAQHLRSLMQGLLRILTDQTVQRDHFAVRQVRDNLRDHGQQLPTMTWSAGRPKG